MVTGRRISCPQSDRSHRNAWHASNSIAAQRPNDQFRVPGAQSRPHPWAGVSINLDEVTPTATDTSSQHSTVPDLHSHCNAGEKPRSRHHIPDAPCTGFNGRPPELWLPSGGPIDCTHIALYRHVLLSAGSVSKPKDDLDTTAFARATSGRSKGRASPHALLRCAR
jgi:hypothetical protein